MRGERSIDYLLAGYRSIEDKCCRGPFASGAPQGKPATRWRVADQREALADRPSWDMSPANAGLSGSQRPLELGHSGRASALFDLYQYCGDCLLIEVIFQSKVTHMADRKTWRPIIFSCQDTGDRSRAAAGRTRAACR